MVSSSPDLFCKFAFILAKEKSLNYSDFQVPYYPQSPHIYLGDFQPLNIFVFLAPYSLALPKSKASPRGTQAWLNEESLFLLVWHITASPAISCIRVMPGKGFLNGTLKESGGK